MSSPRRAARPRPAYLKGLGAADIIDRNELSAPGRPLGKERWAGVVDAVGSHTLANVLSMTRYGGAVAACGLAQGLGPSGLRRALHSARHHACGIDSVMAPMKKREAAWSRLAKDLDLGKLDAMTSRATLKDVPQLGTDILAGKVRGRVVVDVNA